MERELAEFAEEVEVEELGRNSVVEIPLYERLAKVVKIDC